MRILSLLHPLGKLCTAFPVCRRKSTYCLQILTAGKLTSSNFKAILTPQLLRLESVFKSEGYGFRLVGGVVRDILLGHTPKDIDIATDCTPDDMIQMFEEKGIRYIPTGLQHGTVTVHFEPDVDYEVTTLRVDRITDGRHAIVDFTRDWKLDALRRDLTINAMSLTLDGTLYDYFNGQKHLAERRVVFVGNTKERIEEDYLRILRYFRFYGRITPEVDHHDGETLRVIQETTQGLKGVSVERVWMEVRRILPGNHAPHLIRLMYKLGVADAIGIPLDGNLEELVKVWSTMRHSNCDLQPVTLLVTLIHTIPEAYDLAHAWKLSNNEKKLGAFIVKHREKAYNLHTPTKYYQDMLVDGEPASFVLELLHYSGNMKMAEQISNWKVPKLPVNGNDLKEEGFQPGPGVNEIGSILRRIKTKWKDSYYTMNKEELLEFAHKIRSKQDEEETRTKH